MGSSRGGAGTWGRVSEVDVRHTGERDLDAEILRLFGDVRPDDPA